MHKLTVHDSELGVLCSTVQAEELELWQQRTAYSHKVQATGFR